MFSIPCLNIEPWVVPLIISRISRAGVRVTAMLGIIDQEALWEIAQKIIERNTKEALGLVEKVINEGKDLAQFIAGLMEHFRNIMITKISSKNLSNLIELPADFVQRISAQGTELSFEEIFYIFNVLMRAQGNLRRALSSRVIVEMAIVKLTQRENLSSLEAILTRLAKLEQDLAGQNCPQEQPRQDSQQQPQQDPQKEQANPAPAAVSVSPEGTHSWPAFLAALKEEKMFLASSLELAEMRSLKDSFLTIAFPEKYKFYKETMEHAENKKIIEAKAKQVFGQNFRVKFVLDKNLSLASPEEKEAELESEQRASAEPIIQSALKMFQGRIIKKAR